MAEETGLAKALVAKGWLATEEREFLFNSVNGLTEKDHVMNIGVEYGASVVCFAEGNKKITIVAVDIDMSKWPYGEIYHPKVELVEADSKKGAKGAAKLSKYYRYIDVLFVDGDHSYEGVMVDTEYAKLVKDNGLVIFHDCFDWDCRPDRVPHKVCPGVNRAVEKWYEQEGNKWEELQHVGTMRIFKRI